MAEGGATELWVSCVLDQWINEFGCMLLSRAFTANTLSNCEPASA